MNTSLRIYFCILIVCTIWIECVNSFSYYKNDFHCKSMIFFPRQRKGVYLLSSMNGDNDNPKKRKKKKNKYAKFSKTDQLTADPLESMIQESKQQLQELSEKKKKKQQQPSKAAAAAKESMKLEFPNTREIDPYDPTTYGYVELGTIVGAHGVKGWVKVNAVTDFPERLIQPGIRHMKATNRRSPRQTYLLDGKHTTGDDYLIQLEGIIDRTAAQQLRGCILYARETERPSVENDEYLISDLVGCQVFGTDDQHIGMVDGIALAEDMCATPGLGQDWLELDLTTTANNNNQQQQQKPKEYVLIPFVPSIVPTVDLSNQRIIIDPPAGLLDLTYQKQPKVRIKGFLPAKSSYVPPPTTKQKQ